MFEIERLNFQLLDIERLNLQHLDVKMFNFQLLHAVVVEFSTTEFLTPAGVEPDFSITKRVLKTWGLNGKFYYEATFKNLVFCKRIGA